MGLELLILSNGYPLPYLLLFFILKVFYVLLQYKLG
jgi:hypothetical protein